MANIIQPSDEAGSRSVRNAQVDTSGLSLEQGLHELMASTANHLHDKTFKRLYAEGRSHEELEERLKELAAKKRRPWWLSNNDDYIAALTLRTVEVLRTFDGLRNTIERFNAALEQ